MKKTRSLLAIIIHGLLLCPATGAVAAASLQPAELPTLLQAASIAGLAALFAGQLLRRSLRRRRAMPEVEPSLWDENRHLRQQLQTLTQEAKRLGLINRLYGGGLEGLVMTDADARILEVSPAMCRITGYEAQELLGGNPRELKSNRHSDDFYRELWMSLLENGHWEGEIWNRRKSGEVYPEWLRISSIRNEQGKTTHYISLHQDISEHKQKDDQIRRLAMYDALTGLPNRMLLLDRIRVAQQHCQRSGRHLALLALDLDNFKAVNDSFGHPFGDSLLLVIGEHLGHSTRNQDSVSRFGGDMFVVLLDNLEEPVAAAALTAQRIRDAFARPLMVAGRQVSVSFSIGGAVYPSHGSTPDELIRNAEIAMYRAKEEGRARYHVFDPAWQSQALERAELERQLRLAVEAGGFQVYYQPIVDALSGTITGTEALVRWPRPDGMMPPDQFIPVAEKLGLIQPLSMLIYEKALRQLRQWQDRFGKDFQLSLNLSPRQLFDEPQLAQVLQQLIESLGIASCSVELEITETAVMQDIDRALPLLQRLADQGFRLALDDFGTGYSSLNYLKRLPINKLKIDRSFVRDLPGDAQDATIVEAVLAMAASLRLTVQAEGVETREQRDFLRRRGCHLLQGFLFSRPVPAAELELLLEMRDQWTMMPQ